MWYNTNWKILKGSTQLRIHLPAPFLATHSKFHNIPKTIKGSTQVWNHLPAPYVTKHSKFNNIPKAMKGSSQLRNHLPSPYVTTHLKFHNIPKAMNDWNNLMCCYIWRRTMVSHLCGSIMALVISCFKCLVTYGVSTKQVFSHLCGSCHGFWDVLEFWTCCHIWSRQMDSLVCRYFHKRPGDFIYHAN